MRLALITPGYAAPDERDFAIPALTDTVRALASRHDVHVFTLRYPHRRSSYQFDGATVHAFGWATTGGLRRLRLLQTAVAAIRREHRRQPFDLFHGLWADEPGFVATAAGRLLAQAVSGLDPGRRTGRLPRHRLRRPAQPLQPAVDAPGIAPRIRRHRWLRLSAPDRRTLRTRKRGCTSCRWA